jgi:hypothetical protein
MTDSPYRAPVPSPPDPYEAAWSDLRRRRKWLIGCLVGLGMAYLLRVRSGLGFVSTPVVVMTLVTIVASIYGESFRCPSCGERFCRRSLFHNGFTRRCLHCRIAMGTPKGP